MNKQLGVHLSGDSKCPYSRPQLHILAILLHANQTPGHLASQLSVTPGAVTQFTLPLLTEGIIEKIQDGNDKRVFYFQLTEKGKQQYTSAKEVFIQKLLPLFENLTIEEMETLVRLQQKILFTILPTHTYV